MPVGWKHRKTAQMGMKRTAMARRGRSSVSARIGRSLRAMPAALASSRTELKSLDVPLATYALNTTGSVQPLNLIRAGTSFNNRVGRKVEGRSIRVSGTIDAIRTVTGNDYARVMIVYDRQSNGGAPAIADILQTVDQAGNGTTTSYSGVNLNNRDRFIILRDERIYLPTVTVTAGVETNTGPTDPVAKTFNFDWFVRLPNLLTQFKADSSPAVIGDISSGSLLLVTFATFASGSEGYAAELESRFRYTDL